MRRATVVFPVPGLPVKHMCREGGSAESPTCSAQSFHQQQRGDLADTQLHGIEADQFFSSSRSSPSDLRSRLASRR